MFIGEYQYSIDQKKRMAIPAKLRKELGSKAIITRGLDRCLVIYPTKEWGILANRLQELPTSRGDARGFVRLLLSGAMDVALDKLGRILIPDYLKEYASLKKNVTIIGMGNRIEVWNNKNWEIYKKGTEKEVGNIAERLEELGI